MSSSRCTCCHVCHTSLKTSRRSFYPCSVCPTIICRQCIELTGQEWDHVNSQNDWSCPRCQGDCPCKRCRNKVTTTTTKTSNEKKKSSKRKRTPPTTVNEENAFSSLVKFQRTSARQLSMERSRTANHESERATRSSSSSTINRSEVSSVRNEDRVKELCRKNQQCLSYIARTERLLTLIRSEQGRIYGELQSLASANENIAKSFSSGEEMDPQSSPESFADAPSSSSAEDSDEGEFSFSPDGSARVVNESSSFPLQMKNLAIATVSA